MDDQPRNDEQKSFKLIQLGAEIAGSAAGVAIDLLGAPGVGPVAQPLITRALASMGEFAHRKLGHREQVRIGATLAFAIQSVEQKRARGWQVRQDGFFSPHLDERSTADEIIEGVLLAAQREHEEKKLKHYGHLVASIGFDATVDRATANTLLTLAQQLSYQQLCYVALLVRRGTFDLSTTDQTVFDYFLPEASRVFTPQVALARNIYDLFQRGVVLQGGPGQTKQYTLLPFVTTLGHALYNLMSLADIPASDVSDIAHVIRSPRELSGVQGRPVGVWRLASDNHVHVHDIVLIFLRNSGHGFTIDGVEVTKRSDASTATWPAGYPHDGSEIVECANGQKFVIGTSQFDGLAS